MPPVFERFSSRHGITDGRDLLSCQHYMRSSSPGNAIKLKPEVTILCRSLESRSRFYHGRFFQLFMHLVRVGLKLKQLVNTLNPKTYVCVNLKSKETVEGTDAIPTPVYLPQVMGKAGQDA